MLGDTFRSCLKDSIKDCLPGLNHNRSDYTAFRDICIEIDDRVFKRSIEKRGNSGFTNNFNSGGSNSTPSATQKNKGIKRPITDGIRKYRKENNLCMYDGEAHSWDNCPKCGLGYQGPKKAATTAIQSTPSTSITEGPPAETVCRAKKPCLHSLTSNAKTQDHVTSEPFSLPSPPLTPPLPPLTLASSKITYPHPRVTLAIEMDSGEEKSSFVDSGCDETVIDTELVKENPQWKWEPLNQAIHASF